MTPRALHVLSFFLLLMPGLRAATLDVETFLSHPPNIGTAELAGYVVEKYACPPCPPGAMCKPCMGDSVPIADTPTAPPAKGLRILCPATSLPEFQPGRFYWIEVEISAIRSAAPFVGEVHLRTARPRSPP
jgi:hypothetical protein